MTDTAVVLTLEKGHATAKMEGTRVTFSPHQCFAFDHGPDDVACLRALGAHLLTLPGLALVGSKRFIDYLLHHVPGLDSRIVGAALYENLAERHQLDGLATVKLGALPCETQTAFLCETLAFPRMQMMKQLPQSVTIVDLTVLADIAPDVIPARGWTPLPRNIYPIEIP